MHGATGHTERLIFYLIWLINESTFFINFETRPSAQWAPFLQNFGSFQNLLCLWNNDPLMVKRSELSASFNTIFSFANCDSTTVGTQLSGSLPYHKRISGGEPFRVLQQILNFCSSNMAFIQEIFRRNSIPLSSLLHSAVFITIDSYTPGRRA